jgi:hypothetical protein
MKFLNFIPAGVAMKTALLILLVASAVALAQPPELLWERGYPTETRGSIEHMIPLPEQQIAAVGYCCGTYSHGDFLYHAIAQKFDSAGNPLWTYSWYPEETAVARKIKLLHDGGFVVTGWTSPFGSTDIYYADFTFRLNAAGDTVWTGRYCTDYCGGSTDIVERPDGSFLRIGTRNITVVILSADGQFQSSHSYGVDLMAMAPAADGGYLCAIRSDSIGVLKISAAGDSLWQRYYNPGVRGSATAIEPVPGGGFLLGGWANTPSVPCLLRLAEDGSLLWQRNYPSESNGQVRSIAPTSDGGWIITTNEVLRTNADGDTLWTKTFLFFFAEQAYQLPDGSYMIGGSDFYAFTHLARLAPEPLDVPPVAHASPPHDFSLSAFPNPFNPATTIAFTLPQAGFTTLRVYDILGREIAILSNGRLEAGEHNLTFNGSSLPSGLYFARLNSGAFTSTQKLLLLK